MPREKTSRFLKITFLVLASAAASVAQAPPSSGEVMRNRIMRAKALIATRNYNGSIFELENIRRETADQAVQGVVNVLLMHCFLEQGDYRRAHDFLDGFFDGVRDNKPGAAENYYLVAGQVVKGARMQTERYRSLGLNASDRSLPTEAGNDIEKIRDMLERVAEQAKELVKIKDQSSNASSLLEETSNARAALARDDFDSNRWKEESADAREMFSTSRSVILSAVEGEGSLPVTDTVAQRPVSTLPVGNQRSGPSEKQTVTVEVVSIPVVDDRKEPETVVTGSGVKPVRERRVISSPEWRSNSEPGPAQPSPDQPLSVGSLSGFAIQRTEPVYPPKGRSSNASGTVRVELIVSEDGSVAQVTNVTGPQQLTSPSIDAAQKWRFAPFKKDGRPTKAVGYLEFSYTP